MIVLGIETSCDETGIGLLKDGKEIIASITRTQYIHSDYGGVVPELASREHLQFIYDLIEETLKKGNISYNDIDLMSVTKGPGLIGALLVGINVAKGVASSLDIPIIGVNHIEGHIHAAHLYKGGVEFPFIALIVSGGHTLLIDVKNDGDYTICGSTIDDAAGEAFDKTAKLMGLGYPGGPLIEKYASQAEGDIPSFPIAKVDKYNFSYSGMKTAVRYYIEKKGDLSDDDKKRIAKGVQEAIVSPLVSKSIKLCKEKKYKRLVLSGGVAANGYLRKRLQEECGKNGIELIVPPIKLCTDNGEMIASAGYAAYMRGERDSLDMKGDPSLKHPFKKTEKK